MNPDVAKYGLDPIPIIVVGGVMLLLTAIAIFLRIYVRAFLIRCFGWDDKLLLMAFACFAANCIDLVIMGKNQATQSIEESTKNNGRVTIAGVLLYILSEIFIKLSAAIFFLRIVQERWQRQTIKISVSFYVFYMVFMVFITIFQCGNPANILTHQHCLPWKTGIGPVSYLSGALTAATDWVFVITTLALVLKTQMPARAKASVCFLISLAALGSVVSIIRIPFIRGGRVSLAQAAKMPKITVLSTIEAGLSIISLSLATIRPLVRTWVDAITSKHSSDDVQAAKAEQMAIELQRFQAVQRVSDDLEASMKRPTVFERADSHQHHLRGGIVTINMPSEVSGHCGVLDSVDRDER